MFTRFQELLVILLFVSASLSGQNPVLNREKEAAKAELLWTNGNYKEALDVLFKLAANDSTTKNETNLIKDYNNIGHVYKLLAAYDKAVHYNLKALKLAEKNKDQKILGVINGNLGGLYGIMRNQKEAKKYFSNACEPLRQVKDYRHLAVALTGLASVSYSENDIKKTEQYFEEAEKICEENGLEDLLGDIYVNRSFNASENGDNLRAKEYAFKAKAIFKKFNDNSSVAIAYINLQTAYTNEQLDTKAPDFKRTMRIGLAFLDSAENVLQGISSPEHYINIYRNKAHIYLNLANVDSADYYQGRYETLKDSVYNLEKMKQIDELKIRYESEKKEQNIQLLEKENALLIEKAKKRQLYIAFSIGAACLLIFIILFINHSRKKKQEADSARDKAIFELQALMAQMNPHFLFNALNSIQDFILEKSKHEAYDYLAKFSKLVRMVLNNSEDKMVPLQRELELIKLYVELEQLRFTNGFDFTLEISPDINTDALEVPTMLIQPYVENAIWHGLMNLNKERKGELSIRVGKNNGLLKIIIKDNGVGRKTAAQYRKEEMHKPVGMKLTERRLQMINKMQGYENASVSVSDLYNQKQEVVGTRVEINLPLA